MISTLFALLVFAVVVSLLWWGITRIPLPEPIGMIVQVVFVLVVALVLLGVLFGGVSVPSLRF